MSLRTQQNFLARIYTDDELRGAFLNEPERIGAEHDLSEREIAELRELLPAELNFFAESLFWKRLRETEKFLPLTRETLGTEFAVLFRAFSQNYNPRTVKKHLEDALEFCGFLSKSEISEIAKNAAKFERAKLEFYGFGRNFAFCRLDFDLREVLPPGSLGPSSKLSRKTKFAVWVRLGKRISHFII